MLDSTHTGDDSVRESPVRDILQCPLALFSILGLVTDLWPSAACLQTPLNSPHIISKAAVQTNDAQGQTADKKFAFQLRMCQKVVSGKQKEGQDWLIQKLKQAGEMQRGDSAQQNSQYYCKNVFSLLKQTAAIN